MSETPARSWKSRLAGWFGRLVVVAAFLAVTPVVAGAAMISPWVADDVALDRTVRAVALDWRDFGRDRARARLDYELDHQAIGLQVGDEDCRLDEADGVRTVSCAWTTEVRVPGLAGPLVLPFSSSATVTADGELR